jgi:hypothetical protein
MFNLNMQLSAQVNFDNKLATEGRIQTPSFDDLTNYDSDSGAGRLDDEADQRS